ncbi:MAG: PIN domain-containing protein, partial [Cyanobacteria bacterium P01_C01_bin.70]
PQIVIDTNVLVAGLRSRNGSAFRLLSLVDGERFNIHLSVPLVLEYEVVLLRELPNLPLTLWIFRT